VFVGPPKKPGNPETAVAKGEPRPAHRKKSGKPALAAKSTTPSPAPAHRKKSAPAAAAAPAPAPAAPAPAAPAPAASPSPPSTHLFSPAPTIAPAGR
jgi:hypothetical protein